MNFGDRGSGSRFLHRSSRRRCRRHDASACSRAVDADVVGRRLVETVAPPKPPMPPMPPLVQGAAGRRVPGPAAHPRVAAPSCAGGRPFALVPARPERVIGQRRRQGLPRGQRAAQVGRGKGRSRWVASVPMSFIVHALQSSTRHDGCKRISHLGVWAGSLSYKKGGGLYMSTLKRKLSKSARLEQIKRVLRIARLVE